VHKKVELVFPSVDVSKDLKEPGFHTAAIQSPNDVQNSHLSNDGRFSWLFGQFAPLLQLQTGSTQFRLAVETHDAALVWIPILGLLDVATNTRPET
jgi:hypothetical protein